MSLTRRDLTRVCVAVLACGGLSACGGSKSGNSSKADAGDMPDAGDQEDGAAPDGDSGVDDALTPAYRDGTRLRAQWWKAEGSEPLFAGWYDTKLKTKCSFEPLEDGSYRCLPLELRGFSVSTDPADCDAGDALDVLYFPSEPAPGQLIALYGNYNTGCGGLAGYSAIHRLGERIDASTLPECIQGHGEHVYEKGELLAMSEFVGAKLEVADVGDRLGVMMYVAADGARGPKALYDTKAEHECSDMVPDADGIYRCLPLELARPDFGYRDAECTQGNLLSPVDGRNCAAPKIAVATTLSDTCTTSNQFFEVGAKFEKPGYQIQFPDQCVALPPESTRLRYVRGPELDADTLAAARVTPAGKGRLRPLMLTTMEGVALMQHRVLLGNTDFRAEGTFNDEDLGVTCRPKQTPQGAIHCVPVLANEGYQALDVAELGYGGFQYFQDEGCTEPLRPINDEQCASPFVWTQSYVNTDSRVSAVYKTRATTSLEAVYMLYDGECLSLNGGRFQAVEEVPLSTFAEVVHQP